MYNNKIFFSGNSNIPLFNSIISKGKFNKGRLNIYRYSDGEIGVEILDSVRKKDVFVFQSLYPNINEYFMEMVILIDAIKRSGSNSITLIIPYFGYSRQDRKDNLKRTAISSKVIVNILQTIGVNHVITIDLHAEQIQGFFDIMIDNIYSYPIVINNLNIKNYSKLAIISPDFGGIKRVYMIAKKLNINKIIIINKYRPEFNKAKILDVIGNPNGLNCLIIDDIIDTAGTLLEIVKVLKKYGCNKIISYCTHGILSKNAIYKINDSLLDELIITDTILQKELNSNKIRIISCSNLIIKVINKLIYGNSIKSLYN